MAGTEVRRLPRSNAPRTGSRFESWFDRAICLSHSDYGAFDRNFTPRLLRVWECDDQRITHGASGFGLYGSLLAAQNMALGGRDASPFISVNGMYD